MRAASIGSGAAASSFASSPNSSGLRRLPFPSSALNSAVSSATSSPVGLRAITRPPVNACRTNQWYTASALLITSVRFECVNSAIWTTRAISVALRTGFTLAIILSSHSCGTHIVLQYAHIRPRTASGLGGGSHRPAAGSSRRGHGCRHPRVPRPTARLESDLRATSSRGFDGRECEPELEPPQEPIERVLVTDIEEKKGRIVAVLGGHGDVEVQAHCRPDGVVSLKAVAISGFRTVRVPRV